MQMSENNGLSLLAFKTLRILSLTLHDKCNYVCADLPFPVANKETGDIYTQTT